MSANQDWDLQTVDGGRGEWGSEVADVVARILPRDTAQELLLALSLALSSGGGGKGGGKIWPPEPFPRGGEELET